MNLPVDCRYTFITQFYGRMIDTAICAAGAANRLKGTDEKVFRNSS